MYTKTVLYLGMSCRVPQNYYELLNILKTLSNLSQSRVCLIVFFVEMRLPSMNLSCSKGYIFENMYIYQNLNTRNY